MQKGIVEKIIRKVDRGKHAGKYLVKWVAHDLDESDPGSYVQENELATSSPDMLTEFMQE